LSENVNCVQCAMCTHQKYSSEVFIDYVCRQNKHINYRDTKEIVFPQSAETSKKPVSFSCNCIVNFYVTDSTSKLAVCSAQH